MACCVAVCAGCTLLVAAGWAKWSPDSQFLATRNDNMPGAVWVWDMAAMELCAVLCHAAPVLDAAWAPQASQHVYDQLMVLPDGWMDN
jgi:hypothetical protein